MRQDDSFSDLFNWFRSLPTQEREKLICLSHPHAFLALAQENDGPVTRLMDVFADTARGCMAACLDFAKVKAYEVEQPMQERVKELRKCAFGTKTGASWKGGDKADIDDWQNLLAVTKNSVEKCPARTLIKLLDSVKQDCCSLPPQGPRVDG